MEATKSLMLMKRCDEASQKHPLSCSHAVWHVIKMAHPEWPYKQANELLSYLVQMKWTDITGQETKAQQLADEGKIVVAGAPVPDGHGHVVIVYPGGLKPSGGYPFVSKGKNLIARDNGLYPRCMSTSIGPWPGSKSCGDKTVFDPWGKADSYKNVKYYAQPASD